MENILSAVKANIQKVLVGEERAASLLNNLDTEAYDVFVEAYPSLTSGSSFDVLDGADVLSVFDHVLDGLQAHGVSGAYIVYDEFSKYLETSIGRATVEDTRLLQDLAEACNRSGAERQLHLLLISHKSLSNYIDADLQTTPEDFNMLLPWAEKYTLVSGIRAARRDSAFKRLQSKIANGFRRMMTGDRATDTGCPLKVLHTDAARRIPFFKGMHRFLPALVTLQEDASFKELPVRHFPRMAGKSKFHLWNRLAGPFADCFAYRWMKKRYINYTIAGSNL